MSRSLIMDWNNNPPPTDAFLAEEARFLETQQNEGYAATNDAYYAMIEAISTPQDLAQFLLRASKLPGNCLPLNDNLSSYWDALAGVVKVSEDMSMANPWKAFAKMLNKATLYE